MPASTTIVNACGVVIKLADAVAAMQDITGQANEAKLSTERKLGDFKVFGDVNTYRLECGKDGKLELKIFYSKAANEALDLLEDWDDVGGLRVVTIDVPDSTPASLGRRYSASWRLESLDLPLKADDPKPIVVSATLQINGALTRSIIA